MIGHDGTRFTIPVLMGDLVLGFRRYLPGGDPKMLCNSGDKMGLVFGFENGRQYMNQPIIICEGEKDTIISSMFGIPNTVCIVGGCATMPRLMKSYFTGRDVVIAYDNDNAGRDGALQLAAYLHEECDPASIGVFDPRSVYPDLPDKGDMADLLIKFNVSVNMLVKGLLDAPI